MDDVEDITIEQSGKFDASNLILPQKQENTTGCAATCAAMSVCQTQSQFVKDGLRIDYAQWDMVAEKYGYTYEIDWYPTLKKVYDFLNEGYPVIVQVNDGSNGQTEHWVTVYQYTGTSTNGSNLNVADFMCVDPWSGDKCKFNTSANFNASSPVNRTVVYKQKVC